MRWLKSFFCCSQGSASLDAVNETPGFVTIRTAAKDFSFPVATEHRFCRAAIGDIETAPDRRRCATERPQGQASLRIGARYGHDALQILVSVDATCGDAPVFGLIDRVLPRDMDAPVAMRRGTAS